MAVLPSHSGKASAARCEEYGPFEVTLTIESYAGDWLSEDPSEPPRLLGSFSGDLVGTFEAIHCGGLDYTTNC